MGLRHPVFPLADWSNQFAVQPTQKAHFYNHQVTQPSEGFAASGTFFVLSSTGSHRNGLRRTGKRSTPTAILSGSTDGRMFRDHHIVGDAVPIEEGSHPLVGNGIVLIEFIPKLRAIKFLQRTFGQIVQRQARYPERFGELPASAVVVDD